MSEDALWVSSLMMLCTIFILGALYGLESTWLFRKRIAFSMWVLLGLMGLNLIELAFR